MTSLDTLSTYIEALLAAAEAELEGDNIGWIGQAATNRALGRVSALREVQDKIAELDQVDERMLRDYMARADLFAEKWIGKDYLAEEKWQNLRDSGYDETDLRRAAGDR